MKKILFINSVYGTKSTGRICFNLCKRLNNIGFDAKTLYSRGPRNDENSVFVGNNLAIFCNVINARLFDNEGLNDKTITRKIIDFIDDFNPDIIHLHNIHGYYLDIRKLFDCLTKKQAKIFITLHDSWLYTGHCCYYLFNKCSEWKSDCKKCKFKINYPSSFLKSNSENNLKIKQKCFSKVKNEIVLITPSNWLKNEVQQSFLNKYPIFVINNGIDLNHFYHKDNKNIKKNEIRLLGLNAVWDERKNLSFFKKLDALLPSNFSIVIVGKIKNNQRRYIKNTRIKHIKFINSVEDLNALYSNASFFINPSLEDNYPSTSLESIACGTPVLAFDVGGVKETIPNGCGFVANNEEELIKLILEKKPFRIELNDNLKEFLSADTQIDKYVELYEQYI